VRDQSQLSLECADLSALCYLSWKVSRSVSESGVKPPHPKITTNSSPPLPHLRALPSAASNHTSRSTCARLSDHLSAHAPSHPESCSTDKASPHETTARDRDECRPCRGASARAR